MRRFHFHRAESLGAVLAFKAEHRAAGRLLAGGTDLIIALRDGPSAARPIQVMDISGVAELRGVYAASNGGAGTRDISLGALVTHGEIESHPLVRSGAPLLAAACAEIGSPQIRNRGTIGGNLCNASPCADTLPPLIALDAALTVQSVRGARELSVADLVAAPYVTTLAEDEVLTSIRIPPSPAGTGSAFIKLGRRKALSIARMNIAVRLVRGADQTMQDVRIAAGSVAPTPRRFATVEAHLQEATPDAKTLAVAGEQMAAEMIQAAGRRWSTAYKEPVVAVLLRRAVRAAAAAAGFD